MTTRPSRTSRKKPAAPRLVRVRLARTHTHNGTGYDRDDVLEVHPETARWMQNQRGLISETLSTLKD